MKQLLALIGGLQFLAALHAEESCPVEAKLLLPPSTIHTVIASIGFGNETRTRVYLFDTDALDLLSQGVIIRVRQGVKNDLTVKVRLPKEKQKIDNSQSSEKFPCEVDLTRSGADTSYSVARKFQAMKAPANGNDIYNLLNASQNRLLHEAQVSIDWGRVTRVASVDSTAWKTTAQSPSGRLALELWEWSAGKALELSAKAQPEAGTSKLADLERLLQTNNLSLSANQDTKTNVVLKPLADHASGPR